tara:strand:- start:132 stop:434 length:303 start_codon:yes stop_codon:yes gene_type:complete
MATLHHNISGELTQQLLAAGDAINVSKISFTVTSDNYPVRLDLYIEKKLTGKFYILKDYIFQGSFTHEPIRFNNASNEFGLFIKLTKIGSTTPTVDVIIN